MKKLIALFVFAMGASFLVPAAQGTDFVFSSFQCDPVSCIETTAVPVTQGSVSVSFNGTCTGGVVAGIEAFATAQVGIPNPCQSPYTPRAQISINEQELLDDFGCTYLVDTEINRFDIFDASGINVFNNSSGSSCDGSTTGPFTAGTRPC
jgi:hypothetical protein